MKIKKKNRRLISICILLILLIIFIYFIKRITSKNTISNQNEVNTQITTGKNLKLPSFFEKYNLTILENDKIVEYSKNESMSNYVLVKTQKTISEVFDEYSKIYENPMSLETEETKTIITGNEKSVLKILISKGEYNIIIENRE